MLTLEEAMATVDDEARKRREEAAEKTFEATSGGTVGMLDIANWL